MDLYVQMMLGSTIYEKITIVEYRPSTNTGSLNVFNLTCWDQNFVKVNPFLWFDNYHQKESYMLFTEKGSQI